MNKVRYENVIKRTRENRLFTEIVAQIIIQKGKLCIKCKRMSTVCFALL